MNGTFAVLGGGMAGCVVALALADRGARVVLLEAGPRLVGEASRINEGKVHLGLVYAADPSLATAHRMIEGALLFREVLARWLPEALLNAAVTAPFDYLAAEGTQVPPAAIETHFAAVARHLAEREAATGRRYLGLETEGPLWERRREHAYGRGARAAWRTGERGVDSHALADALAAVVAAHPRIETRVHRAVTRCEVAGGRWRVEAEGGLDKDADGPFEGVVNATWRSRRALDAASGLGEGGAWFDRWKAGLTVPAAQVRIAFPGGPPRPLTALLGPYGDVVPYPDGRLYLSWYPAALLAGGAGASGEVPALGAARRAGMWERTLAEFGRLVPALEALAGIAATDVEVAAGFIEARGLSDIDDPRSGLHARDAVGPRLLAPSYVTLDTGKLTLAPAFGVEAAALLGGTARAAAR